MQYRVNQKFRRDPPERRRQTRVGWGKLAIFVVLTLLLGGCTSLSFYRSCGVNFKHIRQGEALSRANRGVSWAFLCHW